MTLNCNITCFEKANRHIETREIIAFIADCKKNDKTGLGKTELIFQDGEQEVDSFTLKNLNRGVMSVSIGIDEKDKLTKLFSKAIDIIFINSPQRTSFGILLGIVCKGGTDIIFQLNKISLDIKYSSFI